MRGYAYHCISRLLEATTLKDWECEFGAEEGVLYGIARDSENRLNRKIDRIWARIDSCLLLLLLRPRTNDKEWSTACKSYNIALHYARAQIKMMMTMKLAHSLTPSLVCWRTVEGRKMHSGVLQCVARSTRT